MSPSEAVPRRQYDSTGGSTKGARMLSGVGLADPKAPREKPLRTKDYPLSTTIVRDVQYELELCYFRLSTIYMRGTDLDMGHRTTGYQLSVLLCDLRY
eukprot:1559690-Rhodomonas_salina.2